MAKNYQTAWSGILLYALPRQYAACAAIPQGKREVVKKWIFLALLAIAAWKFATVLDLERLVYSTPGATAHAR